MHLLCFQCGYFVLSLLWLSGLHKPYGKRAHGPAHDKYASIASISSIAPHAQVHERTLQGDFLMALLRDIVAARRCYGHPLKVLHPHPRRGPARAATGRGSSCSTFNCYS